MTIAGEDYGNLRDYLQLVKQLQASGQGSETDVLKTTVDLNNAMIDIEARKVAFRNSLLTLSQATGLSSDQVTDVDSNLVSTPFDTTFYAERSVDLASQELMLKQAELESQVVGAKLKPAVSLGADAGALTSLPNVRQGLANVFGASVGISIAVPLFTFGSVEDNFNASEANVRVCRCRTTIPGF